MSFNGNPHERIGFTDGPPLSPDFAQRVLRRARQERRRHNVQLTMMGLAAAAAVVIVAIPLTRTLSPRIDAAHETSTGAYAASEAASDLSLVWYQDSDEVQPGDEAKYFLPDAQSVADFGTEYSVDAQSTDDSW